MTFSDPIDRSRLQEYSGGDVEFEQELLDLFVSDAQEHLAAIRDAMAMSNTSTSEVGLQSTMTGQDLETIYQAAHHLKGSSGNIGADRFQTIVAQLEQAAREGLKEQCPSYLDSMEQAYSELVSHIAQWSG